MYTETRRDDEVRLTVADRFDHVPDRGVPRRTVELRAADAADLLDSAHPLCVDAGDLQPVGEPPAAFVVENRDCLRTARTLEPACAAAKGVKPG